MSQRSSVRGFCFLVDLFNACFLFAYFSKLAAHRTELPFSLMSRKHLIMSGIPRLLYKQRRFCFRIATVIFVKQNVNFCSLGMSVTAGVPLGRGRVLRPLLFSVYVNDMPKLPERNCPCSPTTYQCMLLTEAVK